MNLKQYSCLALIILVAGTLTEVIGQTKSDTTILIENCLKKTVVKEGSKTSTSTEILDCFWESGTDTIIKEEDCIHQTVISKMGYTRTSTKRLDCYWDDATSKGDTLLVPKGDNFWRLEYYIKYEKDGNSKLVNNGEYLNARVVTLLGLDTLPRNKYKVDNEFYQEFLVVNKNYQSMITLRDTILDEQAVLRRVNEIRADFCQCGAESMPPTTSLEWSDKLAYIAYLHAKDMYLRQYFSHISPEGEDPGDRIRKSGIKGIVWGGENISKGQSDEISAVEDWKKSPGHCRNMMDSSHRHVGVGVYMGKYVMLLGKEF